MPGHDDPAASRGPSPDPGAPRARRARRGEAILTGGEEATGASPLADPEEAAAVPLAPDSASEAAGAGLADIPRLTPGPEPASRGSAAAVAAVAGLAFAGLTVWVASHGAAVPALDEAVHRWAVTHRGPGSVAVARAAAWGGISYVVLPALIVVGAASAPRGRGLAQRIGSGLLPALVASTGVYAEIWINHIIDRARPPVADWAGAASGASYPSGHTTAATLFAVCAAWAIAARVRPGGPRRAVWAGAAAYAATVGWSRVWLGVHWPTDVAGAWLFGTVWTAGCIAAITLPAVRTRRRAEGQSRPRTRSRSGRPSGSYTSR